MLKKIKTFILDTLFPINCITCGKENIWLCDDCFSKIPIKLEQVCPICEKNITPDGRVCFSCRKKSAFNGLLVATSYQNKTVAEAVHYYKYRFVEDIHVPLGEILIRAYLDSRLPIPDLIIPVPLHKRRLRWRGFNQSKKLADHIGNNLTPGFPIPVANDLLVRKKYTRPQMEIKNYQRRKENLRNAFEITRPSNNSGRASYTGNANGANNAGVGIKNMSVDPSCDRNWGQLKGNNNPLSGRTVLLIDDIATTGTTLFECAKVLKQNGTKEVFGVVVARQEINPK